MNDADFAANADGRPLRVAIVGSGPAGFYAAEALLRSDTPVEVAVFEKFPVPYGLVRFGVAPDHAKIRNVIKTFEKTAKREGFSFWGNVPVGDAVGVDELKRFYDAVILAFGAQTDRRLHIPGEDLPRSYTATAFCAWYNGHPEYRDEVFDLTHPSVVVIGQGNVAIDVTRMLAKSPDALAETDIASHAHAQLAESRVRDIHIVGRRGPAQAKFTPKEIQELGEIADCDVIVDPADLELDEASAKELERDDAAQQNRNMRILRDFVERGRTGASRRIHIHFLKSPKALEGEDGVESVVLEKNRLEGEPGALKARGTGETERLEAQVLFRSVGYHGVPIPGIPFDEKRGVIPNEGGRVEKGLYATGWIKRGPSGLIGTNKKDSEETVEKVLADLPALAGCPEPSDDALRALLAERGVRPVSYEEWRRIDAAEVERGKAKGKPRENFTRVEQMLEAIES